MKRTPLVPQQDIVIVISARIQIIQTMLIWACSRLSHMLVLLLVFRLGTKPERKCQKFPLNRNTTLKQSWWEHKEGICYLARSDCWSLSLASSYREEETNVFVSLIS